LFQVLNIFQNEYEFNSLYINDINNDELGLYVRNLAEVGEHVSLDFKGLFFGLLERVLFYCKDFKVRS
jgi:hypothetical protein